MKKNILIIFVIIIAVFIFAPTLKVNATQVYVGVQLNRVVVPGCTAGTSNCPGASPAADTNWCLQLGSQIAITNPGTCSSITSNSSAATVCSNCGLCVPAISPSVNPITITSRACVGGNTIWSGLLDLTNNGNYNVYLWSKGGTCPGYINGSCWVSHLMAENCCSICAYYGLTANGGESNCAASNLCYNDWSNDDSNCSTEAALMGSACSTCTMYQPYAYYNTSTGACYTPYSTSSYAQYSCSAAPTGAYRVCACNWPNASSNLGFIFPFTASW